MNQDWQHEIRSEDPDPDQVHPVLTIIDGRVVETDRPARMVWHWIPEEPELHFVFVDNEEWEAQPTVAETREALHATPPVFEMRFADRDFNEHRVTAADQSVGRHAVLVDNEIDKMARGLPWAPEDEEA